VETSAIPTGLLVSSAQRSNDLEQGLRPSSSSPYFFISATMEAYTAHKTVGNSKRRDGPEPLLNPENRMWRPGGDTAVVPWPTFQRGAGIPARVNPYGHLALVDGASRLTLAGPRGISASLFQVPERLQGPALSWNPPSTPTELGNIVMPGFGDGARTMVHGV